jgi:hypothetical protein
MMVSVVTITIQAMMAHRTFVGLLTPVDLIEGTRGSDYRLQVRKLLVRRVWRQNSGSPKDSVKPSGSAVGLFIYEEDIKEVLIRIYVKPCRELVSLAKTSLGRVALQ